MPACLWIRVEIIEGLRIAIPLSLEGVERLFWETPRQGH